MSRIHYFQRYSTKENTVTNNTLLLLSRLYDTFPKRFFDFLNELTKVSLQGVTFEQQTRESGKHSIPDGSISQSPFRLLVETKLDRAGFHKDQLIAHLEHFSTSTTGREERILLLLSPSSLSKEQLALLDSEFENAAIARGIIVVRCSFEELLEKFRDQLSDWDTELLSIAEDYKDYCSQEGLLASHELLMRVVTSGVSMALNVEHSLYAAPRDRGYSNHSYLGLYADKCVQFVGKLEAIADLETKEGKIHVLSHEIAEPTADMKSRALEYMEKAKAFGWDVESDHRFFFVGRFAKTAFKKTSPRGLWQTRIFNLKDFGIGPDLELDAIAQALGGHTWT